MKLFSILQGTFIIQNTTRKQVNVAFFVSRLRNIALFTAQNWTEAALKKVERKRKVKSKKRIKSSLNKVPVPFTCEQI
jgi:hypothetical protein